MRMLLHVRIPHTEFNAAVRDGSVEKKMKQILEQTKPEAVYFTEYDGRRGPLCSSTSMTHRKCQNLRNHGFYHSMLTSNFILS